MSEFYLSSTLMWNSSLDEMVRLVYESDLDGIEMWAQQWFVKGYQIGEYLRLAALYPIKTCVHSCSWDLNPASINEGIRRASVEEIKKSIDLAAAIGAYEVTIHPGNETFPGMLDISRERMHRSLEEILIHADRKHMDLSLEIMEHKHKEFVTSVSEMGKITQELASEFYYTLDIAHCDSEEIIFDSLKQGKRFSKFHISNRMGSKLHTPLPDGDYNFEELLPKLDAYRLPYIIEGFDSDPEFSIAKKNIQYLKSHGGNRK